MTISDQIQAVTAVLNDRQYPAMPSVAGDEAARALAVAAITAHLRLFEALREYETAYYAAVR